MPNVKSQRVPADDAVPPKVRGRNPIYPSMGSSINVNGELLSPASCLRLGGGLVVVAQEACCHYHHPFVFSRQVLKTPTLKEWCSWVRLTSEIEVGAQMQHREDWGE